VETLTVKDDTIGIKALLSGEVDSYLGTAGALAAAARGIDVKFLGCPCTHSLCGARRAGITRSTSSKASPSLRRRRDAAGHGRPRPRWAMFKFPMPT